jgi:glutathione S-transferase
MAIDLFWSSGSPYCWRVQLALEYKGLAYVSHPLEMSRQEHKAPQILRMNPRGRVPILKVDDYVCFESVAILYYLDRKFPGAPLFGATAEEGAVILRVIEEYQAYIEPPLTAICAAVFAGQLDQQRDATMQAMLQVASEARTIEGKLATLDWVVGQRPSAADFVIYPGIQLLIRALLRREAFELRTRFLPVEVHYPCLARWFARIEALPGYARTYPPHWRQTDEALR